MLYKSTTVPMNAALNTENRIRVFLSFFSSTHRLNIETKQNKTKPNRTEMNWIRETSCNRKIETAAIKWSKWFRSKTDTSYWMLMVVFRALVLVEKTRPFYCLFAQSWAGFVVFKWPLSVPSSTRNHFMHEIVLFGKFFIFYFLYY